MLKKMKINKNKNKLIKNKNYLEELKVKLLQEQQMLYFVLIQLLLWDHIYNKQKYN